MDVGWWKWLPLRVGGSWVGGELVRCCSAMGALGSVSLGWGFAVSWGVASLGFGLSFFGSND